MPHGTIVRLASYFKKINRVKDFKLVANNLFHRLLDLISLALTPEINPQAKSSGLIWAHVFVVIKMFLF
jgi:hypothetical protein